MSRQDTLSCGTQLGHGCETSIGSQTYRGWMCFFTYGSNLRHGSEARRWRGHSRCARKGLL